MAGCCNATPAMPRPRKETSRDPDRRSDWPREEGRRTLSQRHAADRRRHADAGRVRPRAVGLDRPARAHVPGEHAEEPVRALAHGSDARCADARAAARNPQPRLRRRKPRRDRELSGADERRRAGAAVEFAGRSYALAARDSDARSGWCSSRVRKSRGRRIAWRPRSSRRAFRPRRFRFIPAAATSARPCWRAAIAA